MKVTSVNVKKIEKDGSRMKGIASDKLFIAMPSRKYPDGEYRDVAHPINGETREMIEKAVFEAYDNAEDAKAGDSEEAPEEE